MQRNTQGQSVKGLFSEESKSGSFPQCFPMLASTKKINRRSRKNYANNYKTGLSQQAHAACSPSLTDLRTSVFRHPNDGESDVRSKEKKAGPCFFSGDDLIIFFSQGWSKRKEEQVTSVYNLKTSVQG